MNTYDFQRIFGPIEFQNFARDMVQAREGFLFESFAEGRDLGIDNRYISEDGHCVIQQAKRWNCSGAIRWADLKAEKEKLERLERKPDRYILVTSRNVTPGQKQKIMELFSPYIRMEQDIISGEDLNNYIQSSDERFKGVEEKYFKLWIQSTAVLKKLLRETIHSVLVEESKVELDWIIRNNRAFVETMVYRKAMEQLERKKVIIISGEPGMGKTTLARQLGLYYHLKKEYDSFLWVAHVDDLFTACQHGEKRVIIFDDFWGSSYFERQNGGREEDRLARFIEKVQGSDDCILILTTREYILEQGLKQHENLRRLVENYKLECRLRAYSDNEKLEIYFSHLSQSELTEQQLEKLFDLHRTIVQSENYNPRVIEEFLKRIMPQDSPEKCVRQFLDYLENPVDFWKKVFRDLSQEARTLYMILYTFSESVRDIVLRECYIRVLPHLGGSMESQTFDQALMELEKTVTRTDCIQETGALSVKFQNPSAKEFMHAYLLENLDQYFEILEEGCSSLEQYLAVFELCEKNKWYGPNYAVLMKRAIAAIADDDGLSKYMEQFFALLRYYQPEYCGESRNFFQLQLKTFCYLMKCHKLRLTGKSILQFSDGATMALQKGLLQNPEEILELYMNAAIKMSVIPEYDKFVTAYPKIWELYVRKNQEKIIAFLKIYYGVEFYLSVLEQNAMEFYVLVEDYEGFLGDFFIDEIPELSAAIEEYENTLEKADQEDEVVTESEEDQQTYDQIVAAYEEELFESEKEYLDLKELKEALEYEQIPDCVVAQILKIGTDFEPWFWSGFIQKERSIEFLLKVIQRMGSLGKTWIDAMDVIAKYLLEAEGAEAAQIKTVVGNALDVMFRIHRVANMTKQDREEFYEQTIVNEEGRAYDTEFLNALYELDHSLYLRCFARVAEDYLKHWEGMSQEEILIGFLDELDLTVQLDERLEMTGSICNCIWILNGLEATGQCDIMDIFPKQVEPGMLEKLGMKEKEIWEPEYEIRTADIRRLDLLREIGIAERVDTIWSLIQMVAEGELEAWIKRAPTSVNILESY